MSTTSRQSVTLTDPQTAYLKEEAARLGISVSDLIRRIIDQHRAPCDTSQRGEVG